jgi:type II secretory pathway pseudopilin PulG
MIVSQSHSKAKSGMTLLELTVIILVILSLIGILMVGVSAWKRGADRSANILNIRNVQQAVRAHANTRNLNIGDPCPSTDIVGAGRYLEDITEPNSSITYTYSANVPAFGSLYLQASYSNAEAEAAFAPASGSTDDW